MLILRTRITLGIVKQQRLTYSRYQRYLSAAFGEGAGSLMTIGGGLRFRRIPASSDVKSLSSDWYRVGNTIRNAEKKFK